MPLTKLHIAILQKQPRVILAVCGKEFLPGLTFTVAGKKYSLQELSLRIFQQIHEI